MRFHVISLFPQSLDSYIGESIVKRAILDKKIKVFFYNPRDFADNKNDRIDRKPYGGGPGMVIQALPVIKAIEKAVSKTKKFKKSRFKIIFFSPSGKQFNTEAASKMSKDYSDLILICGRYEGIDSRIKKIFKMEDVSVGPYVLTGGELPAMIVIDSVSRQVEGVLGDFLSREEARNASENVYTRPEIIVYKKKKLKVPKVLLSGNHKEIEDWRKNN